MIGERMANNMAFVVATVGFMFIVNGYIPQIPNQTLMDKYVLYVFLFELAILFQTAIAGSNPGNKDIVFEDWDEDLLDEDAQWLWMYLLVNIIVHIIFIILAVKARLYDSPIQ